MVNEGDPVKALGRDEQPIGRLLVALAEVDATIERLRRRISVVRECVDASLMCVRVAQTLTREHANWRESINRDSAKSQLGAETVGRMVEGISRADKRVSELLDHYVDCAKPMKEPVEALNGQLAHGEARHAELTSQLPPELARRHQLLQEITRHPFICGVLQGRCSACNMQLPTVLAQDVRRGRIDSCPSCKRILCAELADAPPRDVSPQDVQALNDGKGRRERSS